MKILKSLAVIIIVLMLLGLYLPKQLSPKFSISRAVVIKAPVSEVFKRLPDLNEYLNWNPFSAKASNQVSGVGQDSFMTWKDKEAGEGKMTITQVLSNHKIKIDMEFYKPFPGKATVYWITVPTPDGNTELKWTYDQELTYFQRYLPFVMKGMLGKQFERGLATYKAIVESSAK